MAFAPEAAPTAPERAPARQPMQTERLTVPKGTKLPAGMRNNNPGNLKWSGSSWQRKNFSGMLGPSTTHGAGNTDQGDPQIAFHLARFIEQVRAIPADPVIVRQNWLRAYDFTTDRGAVALNDYARANDPFANVGRVQVAVDVSSVIRASPDSFRVAWTERRYQDGSLAATERWSAILTIVVQPPRTPDALRKNPLGVFVNALNWSRELSQ